MPRFFFHLYNSFGKTPDEEGRELADVQTARSEAIADIRSLLSEEVRRGTCDLRGRIDISDEADRVLAVVPFGDAVDIIEDAKAA